MKNGWSKAASAMVYTFFFWLLSYAENIFTTKLRLILTFMMSQTGQKIIKIHMLPNISKSKDNQALKLVPLI